MTVSLAQDTDFKEIYDLWKSAKLPVKKTQLEKYDYEQVIKLNPSSCFIGTENGKIIASVFGTFNGRRAWIYHLAIHPRYQDKGFGSLMLKKAETALKNRGAKKIVLGVDFDHAGTISFYAKNDYTIMNDAILMAKELK